MTLSVVHSTTKQPWFVLTEDEDLCVRDSFGRYGNADDHHVAASEAVLERYRQAMNGKCWLACDCRDGEGVEPPLLTISGKGMVRSHLRRMVSEQRSDHSIDCDFWTERSEQAVIAQTYERISAGDAAHLVPVIPIISSPTTGSGCGEPVRVGPHAERPMLARLLAELFVTAGLQRYWSNEQQWQLTDQYKALRDAAGRLELRPGVAMRDYLHTYAPALWSFRKKLQAADPAAFAPAPVHGVFIGLADGAEGNRVTLRHGEQISVTNDIQVFSNLLKSDMADLNDGPFIAAIVFASTNGGQAEAVDAYLHPVLNPRRLMLVSNGYERVTLRELRACQREMSGRGGAIDVTKPLFLDAGSRSLMPDFIVTRISPTPSLTIAIEVACSSRPRYLAMKRRQAANLSKTYGIQTIRHDCFVQSDRAAGAQLDEFRRLLMQTLNL